MMKENEVKQFLISGTIGYSIWKRNQKLILILHDNHSIESYCSKKSIWIANLLDQLSNWDIYVEEPDPEKLKELKSLWTTRHVAEVRQLSANHITQCDIRYNNNLQTIPTEEVMLSYLSHAPHKYRKIMKRILSRIRNPQLQYTEMDESLLYPESIWEWESIFKFLNNENQFECFKDYLFEGYILNCCLQGTKNKIIYAGSWHCRAIGLWLSMSGFELINRRVFPMSHPLEKNCAEINFPII